MPLEEYRKKRRFDRTPEPDGDRPSEAGRRFVVQRHQARREHYDFRLEWQGVLLSWAVPKGPSLDPKEKRLAVRVEDHPVDYADFEGVIPHGDYGAGTVIVWDRGEWAPIEPFEVGLKSGRLKFQLDGAKLSGGWTLIRMRAKPGQKGENWLLIKERDEHALPAEEFDVLSAAQSVKSGRTIEDVAGDPQGASQQIAAPDASASSPGGSERDALPPTDGVVPDWIPPQLAQTAEATPDDDRWIHEIKYDGYRLMCRSDAGRTTLLTRKRQDWTRRFPSLVAAVQKLGIDDAYLDGEVVALLPNGASNFSLLQSSFKEGRADSLVYFVFDLLFYNGEDLRRKPLEERKAILASILPEPGGKGAIQYAEHFSGSGPEFFRQCCRFGLEGVISKRRDKPYRDGRTREWLKSKCVHSDDFVIGGFTEPSGSRIGLGALLLGRWEDDRFVYVGKVGAGFTDAQLAELRQRLAPIETERSPFCNLTDRQADKGSHWVKPALVCQVRYSNWTADGLLWHPCFEGVREDLSENAVADPNTSAGSSDDAGRNRSAFGIIPLPKPSAKKQRPPTSKRASSLATDPLEGFRLTSPERIVYPDDDVTKLDLAAYYFEVSEWLLPHIEDRPIALLRCPKGCGERCFFQKHAGPARLHSVEAATLTLKGESQEAMVIRDVLGLVSLVQWGTIEIHPWGARTDAIEKPDRLTFDLDPGPGVGWDAVVTAAVLIRDELSSIGLTSFVKTTGGVGLHVVCPLQRRQDWDELAAFSHGFSTHLAKRQPGTFTLSFAKAARKGKIYLDYRRNMPGATTVSAYSLRARPGAPCSTPLAWEELTPLLASDAFNILSIRERLRHLDRDPWAGFWNVRQSLTAAMKRRFSK